MRDCKSFEELFFVFLGIDFNTLPTIRTYWVLCIQYSPCVRLKYKYAFCVAPEAFPHFFELDFVVYIVKLVHRIECIVNITLKCI